MPKERYIGDGVYASFDGYQIWLKTPRNGGTHLIALEPAVFAQLIGFAQTFWKIEMPAKAPDHELEKQEQAET